MQIATARISTNDNYDKKGRVMVGAVTFVLIGVAIYDYSPRFNSALKSIFQYSVIANPANLTASIILGGIFTSMGVLMSYIGYRSMKCAEEEGKRSNNPAIYCAYFLSRIFYKIGLLITIISGLITADLAAVYAFSQPT